MKTQIIPTPENSLQINWVMNAENSNAAQSQTPLSSPSTGAQGVQSSPKLAPIVYTIEEAAAVLNCSTKTIRRLLDRQYLTCCNVLRKKLIPRQQIENFLKATCGVPKMKF